MFMRSRRCARDVARNASAGINDWERLTGVIREIRVGRGGPPNPNTEGVS